MRDELVRLGTHDAAQAERVVSELLALPPDRRPTALFAGNNRNAVGALRALRGAERPVALVGFDDFELADLLATPPPSSATTASRWAPTPPRSPSTASTATTTRRAGWSCRPSSIVRGSGEVPPP